MEQPSTHNIGQKGENTAVEFLQNKGYRILARNYVHNKNEIDIIARDKNTIVFVEVKERSTDFFGQPYEAVNKKKQQLIIQVADNYLRRYNIDLEARFDVVSITVVPNTTPRIDHIQNAFSPFDI